MILICDYYQLVTNISVKLGAHWKRNKLVQFCINPLGGKF